MSLPETVEQRDLVLGAVGILENINFAHFQADQFPLGNRHLFYVELLSPGLGLPFDFQIVAKLIEFLTIFARQHDGAGAKAMSEGVHANSSLSLGCLGAGRLLRVASISLELFECCHIVILTNKAKLAGPRDLTVS